VSENEPAAMTNGGAGGKAAWPERIWLRSSRRRVVVWMMAVMT
jgi:hypothetical protein